MDFGFIKLNDGNKIPAIGYGTGSKWKRPDKSMAEFIELAIELGFNHIDTAQAYETESDVSTAIHEAGLSRSEFYLTTKYARGDISDEIHNSLDRLNLRYVDLYLIHQPFFVQPDIGGAWKQMEKIKEAGLSKSIGVSNFKVEHLQQVAKVQSITPAVNQIELHPYNFSEMKPVLEYCVNHGIVVEAYSSLAPITRYPGGPLDSPLAAAAKRRGAFPAQILFLWVRSKGVVIVTTSSSEKHLRQYLAVTDLSPLTKDEIADIEAAGARGPPQFTVQILLRDTALQFKLVLILVLIALLVTRWYTLL